MTIRITSAFDSGNIQVAETGGDAASVTIRHDAHSDFYQWFHFRVSGAGGRPVTVAITNCAGAAYPGGWTDYSARVSEDRETWRLATTRYADGVLTIEHQPAGDGFWLAYFAPYDFERHQRLVARIGQAPGVSWTSVGATLDGREIDLLTLGEGRLHIWLYARQHPGETMAEWWMEGVLDRLTDRADPVARVLRRKATFHIVPNMNPDGSVRGHLRTNAAGVNLNREWAAPSLEKSPEVHHVLAAMDRTGVDFAIDVHGDESIPYVFVAGFHGIPKWTDRQGRLYDRYRDVLARLTPDFQTRRGYPNAAPGKANLAMSTNQLANRFGCVAMTLEMPFKDNADLPDPVEGWSPARSKALGRDCLAALAEIIDDLADPARG